MGSEPSCATVLDRSSLVAAVSAGLRPDYLFFWGHRPRGARLGKWCLSQWWPADFVVDGITYPTAEHFMMAGKAALFGDDVVRQQILSAPDPGEAKKLGRTVANFDDATWEAERVDLVVRGNLAKFGQSPALRSYLLDTREKVLVEASPDDVVWGIGLGEGHPEARDPARWRGANLLGFALMVVRRQLWTAASRPGAES